MIEETSEVKEFEAVGFFRITSDGGVEEVELSIDKIGSEINQVTGRVLDCYVDLRVSWIGKSVRKQEHTGEIPG